VQLDRHIDSHGDVVVGAKHQHQQRSPTLHVECEHADEGECYLAEEKAQIVSKFCAVNFLYC
jgi:hypothetical protein